MDMVLLLQLTLRRDHGRGCGQTPLLDGGHSTNLKEVLTSNLIVDEMLELEFVTIYDSSIDLQEQNPTPLVE